MPLWGTDGAVATNVKVPPFQITLSMLIHLASVPLEPQSTPSPRIRLASSDQRSNI